MADPLSLGVMAAVGIGGTIAGGLIGGKGAEESGQAQANAYAYKAGVALINKQVADQNAAWATQAGGVQAEEQGLKSGQQIAQEKVIQSGSGLDVNTGSTAAVRRSMTDAAKFDQNIISWDAAKTSYGYEIQGVTDTAESNLDVMAGQQAKIVGDIGQTTSFINAGTSVASKWAQGKNIGMFG